MKISYVLYPFIGLFLLFSCSKDKQTEGTGSGGRDTSTNVPPTGTGLNTSHSDSIIKNYKLVWSDEFEGKELDRKNGIIGTWVASGIWESFLQIQFL